MGTSEKIMHYANFNITYGPTEDPMLTHFEDIIWPAFLSDFKRGKKNEHPLFYLSDIALKEISGDMVLVGNYIKDTQYDIRTTVQNGELVSTPSSVPTAPYSRFIIFLKNHRMILVRNESQSPDIRSFQATIRSLLYNYISNENQKIKEKDKKLPHALVNIVDIPLPQDIEETLKDVKETQSYAGCRTNSPRCRQHHRSQLLHKAANRQAGYTACQCELRPTGNPPWQGRLLLL